MDENALRCLRILATVPIHAMNMDTKLPKDFGSGCFVHYKETLLFLTVLHNFENSNLTPCILVDFDEVLKRSFLQPIGKLSYFAMGDLSLDECEIVDFALGKMTEIIECKLLIGSDSEGIVKREDRVVLRSNFELEPNTFDEYGFAGLVYPELSPSAYVNFEAKNILKQEPVFHESLKYKYSDGNYLVFSMKNDDYEISDFKGTSGAPILDKEGNLVSLVVSGGPLDNSDEWIVRGINLAKFKPVIDIECENI